jgi:hypothetical protein
MRTVLSLVSIGAVLVACSGGSGVDGSQSVASLSDGDYTKLCTWYNGKADALNNQKCDNTVVMNFPHIPCGTTNVLKNSSCPAKVGDVESCMNSTDACVATGKNAPSGQCIVVNNCFPAR